MRLMGTNHVAAAALTAVLTHSALAAPVFSGATLTSDISFASALPPLQMGLAYDGSNYYTISGGTTGGNRLAELASDGSVVNTFAPGIDFRSLLSFNGTIYAHEYNTATLRAMTAPGTFAPASITLVGGTYDSDAKIAYDGTNFVARNGDTVLRWTTAGNYLGSTTLVGMANNERGSVADSSMTAKDGLWFTYAINGVLSAWNPANGQRLDTTSLSGAPSTDLSEYSFALANDHAFLSQSVGANNATYLGYAVPEPAGLALLGAGALALRRRRI